MMHVLLSAVLVALVPRAFAWSSNAKYATSCPERCRADLCGSAGARCAFTVLDDCGCCRVCAARRGEACYRTVSGMHGVKCGPGLYCHFYKDEDEYGEEYGVCRVHKARVRVQDQPCYSIPGAVKPKGLAQGPNRDCPYGTYGIECRKTCSCKGGGLCDRETGVCLSFKFLAKLANKRAHEGNELASGDGESHNSTGDGHTEQPLTPKLPPR